MCLKDKHKSINSKIAHTRILRYGAFARLRRGSCARGRVRAARRARGLPGPALSLANRARPQERRPRPIAMSRFPVLSVFLFFAVGAVTGFVRQNKATTQKFFSHKQDPRRHTQNKQTKGERVIPFARKKGARPPHHCVLSCDTAYVSPSADARLSAAIYRFLAL